MSEALRIHQSGQIAIVVLDRPGKLNALDRALWRAVTRAMTELGARDDLRCVVLRGAGGNFGAGADIAEFGSARSDAAQAREYAAAMHEAMAAVAGCRHPTVALIEGACVGGGLELAICCDLRIASASSRFGVPIQKIGVTMAWPEIAALVDLVGRAAALEILLEGRVFPAAEALQKGLVTRVVPDDRVEAEALEAARRIAAGAPLGHRWHKQAIARLRDPAPLTAGEEAAAYQSYDSVDYKEGIAAFLAKRSPEFKGN